MAKVELRELTKKKESDSRRPHDASLGGKQRKVRRREENAEANAEAFDQFWQAFPRKAARENARKAFAAAIERGAEPAVLIEGARRYAGERAGQEPRYTKHPATWLNGGCWDDEPARGAGQPVTIDEHGNPLPALQPRRGVESWEEAADRLIAELEASGGSTW